jgi:anti-sigma B factor antagonist
MALVINQQEREGVVVLTLSGKLIYGEDCNTFNQQIKDLQDANKNRIILNLEEVGSLDSSGLGCLITVLKATRDRGGDLKLLSPSQEVQNLLGLTKLSAAFDIHATEDEAVASFK